MHVYTRWLYPARVERMMKERSGEWGSLWDSALMCSRLAYP